MGARLGTKIMDCNGKAGFELSALAFGNRHQSVVETIYCHCFSTLPCLGQVYGFNGFFVGHLGFLL